MSHSAGEWNLPAPPGFQGFREDLALNSYELDLPHWRQDGATYFVTFRLGDSLPQSGRRMRSTASGRCLASFGRKKAMTGWSAMRRNSGEHCSISVAIRAGRASNPLELSAGFSHHGATAAGSLLTLNNRGFGCVALA